MSRFATRTQLETFLAERLAGHALVCECDWDDEEVRREIAALWSVELAHEYPVTTLVRLVLHGTDHYEAHDFWSGLHLSAAEQRRAGTAMEHALAVLDMERFRAFSTSAESARRFVSVILAHGGIPATVAPRFLRDALLPALRYNQAEDAAELIARWRSNPPAYFPQAVRRFLLYGGRTAIDLLDRLIALTGVPRAELAAHPKAQGLPSGLVLAFLGVPEAEVARAAAWPRPWVEIDPYGAGGPVLRLPPLGEELARTFGEVQWEVDDGSGMLRRVRVAARRDPDPVPLRPAPLWRVRGLAAHREREFAFEGPTTERPLLAFDEHWRLMPLAGAIRAELLYVLAAPTLELASVEDTGLRRLAAEPVGRPGGGWAGYTVREVHLAGVDLLAVLRAGHEIARLEVARPGSGVELLGTPLRDAAGELREPVYGAVPALSLPPGAWAVRLVHPGGIRAAELPPADARRTLALDALPLHADPHCADLTAAAVVDASAGLDVGRYELVVQGRLGTDLRTAFVLVPGLRVGVPDAPLGPDAGEVRLSASADPGVRLFRREGTVELVVEPGETRAYLAAAGRDRRHRAALLVTVPRLRWALRVRDGTQAAFGADRLALDDPDALAAATLVIVTGRPAIVCTIALEAAAGPLAELPAVTADAHGMAKVPLAGLRDALRAAGTSALRLVLRVGSTGPVVLGERAALPPPASDPVGPRPPRLGASGSARIVAVRDHRVHVEFEGYPGVLGTGALPRPPSTYRVGERIEATVVRQEVGRVQLDAHPFDEARARRGVFVEGTVVRVTEERLVLDLGGITGFLYPERLPPGRPLAAWRVGERVAGRIVEVHPDQRRVDVAIVPFNPAAWPDGLRVAGCVMRVPDGLGLITLVRPAGQNAADGAGAVGFVPREQEPDGPRLAEGVPLEAFVERCEKDRERLLLSCRPFNEAGLVVGQRVRCTVTRPLQNRVLVDVAPPVGARGPIHAAIARSELPAHLDVPDGPPKGMALDAVVKALDPGSRHIDLSVRDAADAWSFGATDEASPFSVLRDRVRR